MYTLIESPPRETLPLPLDNQPAKVCIASGPSW